MTSPVYQSIIRDWSEAERENLPESAFCFLDSTTSTSSLLRDRVQSGDAGHFSVLVADQQTAGRGRRGDRWEASPGSNLLFSLALQLPEEPRYWSRLPHLTAMCVGDAVESIMTEDRQIQSKWPNDLYFDARKFCGILVETTTKPSAFAIVGVGLNVNMKQSEFPPELSSIATSICEIEGCEASRWYLLGLILQSFLTRYPHQLRSFETVLRWYRKRDFLLGKKIRVKTVSGDLEGLARGLGENGELRLEVEDGQISSILSAEKIEVC